MFNAASKDWYLTNSLHMYVYNIYMLRVLYIYLYGNFSILMACSYWLCSAVVHLSSVCWLAAFGLHAHCKCLHQTRSHADSIIMIRMRICVNLCWWGTDSAAGCTNMLFTRPNMVWSRSPGGYEWVAKNIIHCRSKPGSAYVSKGWPIIDLWAYILCPAHTFSYQPRLC